MKDLRISLAVAAAFVVLWGGWGCSGDGTEPENLRFGTIGEARLELVTPLLQHQGQVAGALRQELVWSSQGPWTLTEQIFYHGQMGDEDTRRSAFDPEGLAGRYSTWLLQLTQESISPIGFPTGSPDCNLFTTKTRLTLSVRDDSRGETEEWVRCVQGSLAHFEEFDAQGDEGAARVAFAAKLLRNNAFVDGAFEGNFFGSYPFAEIERGGDTSVPLDAPRAIVTEEAWRQFWVQHAGPSATPPTVDFDRDVVLVAGVGRRQEAGDSVEVRRVLPVGDSTIVEITLRRPGRFCSPASLDHTPYHIVLAPADLPRPIRFASPRQVDVPCG